MTRTAIATIPSFDFDTDALQSLMEIIDKRLMNSYKTATYQIFLLPGYALRAFSRSTVEEYFFSDLSNLEVNRFKKILRSPSASFDLRIAGCCDPFLKIGF
jgi:hypothetical protein